MGFERGTYNDRLNYKLAMNLENLRLATPGCTQVLHLNNAGASLMPQSVIDAILEHFHLEVSRGGYEAAEIHSSKIQNFYHAVAKLLNCSCDEIAFIESATRAWDMAFHSLPLKKGDRVLTSEAEYASNYISLLQAVKERGIIIDLIPNDSLGQVCISSLVEKIHPDVKLIALTHIPAQGGLVNPAEEIGKIAREAGIFYLLDATQSVGQFPIDVEKIGCDALCATGRKYLRGPRGTGFLYVRKSSLKQLKPPFLDLHAATWTDIHSFQMKNDATRFETWERNCSHMIGLGVAVDYALSLGLEKIWERILMLSACLRNQLSQIPKVTICDQGVVKCGIVTFTIEGVDPFAIKNHLSEKGINISVSTSQNARLDLEKRKLGNVIRASIHYFNTEEEIFRVVQEIAAFNP